MLEFIQGFTSGILTRSAHAWDARLRSSFRSTLCGQRKETRHKPVTFKKLCGFLRFEENRRAILFCIKLCVTQTCIAPIGEKSLSEGRLLQTPPQFVLSRLT